MKSLTEKIAALETRKAALTAKIRSQDFLGGSFPLGVGCGRASSRKSHYARMDRSIEASRELKKVTFALNRLQSIKRGVDAGECYENGQRRPDAPSRKSGESHNEHYGRFLKANVNPGGKVSLVCDGTTAVVERFLKKHVVLENRSDLQSETSDWEHLDVRPLSPDGSIMSLTDVVTAFHRWKKLNP